MRCDGGGVEVVAGESLQVRRADCYAKVTLTLLLALAADSRVGQRRQARRGDLRKSRDFVQSRLSRSCLSLLLLLLLETVQWAQHDARPRHSASSHPAPPRSHQTLLDFGLFFLDDDSSVQPAVALPKHAVQASPPLAPSTGLRRRSRKHSPRQSALLAPPLGITHSFRFHPADPHQLALGGDGM